MPFVIVRTRSSGAMVTIDAPQVLLKALKSLCITKEDKELGYKPFKFSWIPPREAYRGGLQGKMENTHMSVRKILNTIEAYGWVLVSTHTFTDTGAEYVLQNNTQMATGCVLGGELQGIRKCSSFDELGNDNVKIGMSRDGNNPSAPSPTTHIESPEHTGGARKSGTSNDSTVQTQPLQS